MTRSFVPVTFSRAQWRVYAFFTNFCPAEDERRLYATPVRFLDAQRIGHGLPSKMNNGFAARRMALRRNPRVRFVDVDEFLVMATSRHQLLRAVDEAAGLLGLVDPQTGQTAFIEQEQLDRARVITA